MTVRLTVVSNNLPHRHDLKTEWGFACLVEMPDRTILFDTGQTGAVLLGNFSALNKRPEDVDTLFLSHVDLDHAGGAADFLSAAGNPDIWVPCCFNDSEMGKAGLSGRPVKRVDGFQEIAPEVYSTGEMPGLRNEHGLVLQTPQGLVILTGCAHPGIVQMAEQARSKLNSEVCLVAGGFHYKNSSPQAISADIRRLRGMDVRYVAPSHCTGGLAVEMFQQAWGEHFRPFGCGAVIELDGHHGSGVI